MFYGQRTPEILIPFIRKVIIESIIIDLCDTCTDQFICGTCFTSTVNECGSLI